ncbi:MAG: GNAT family N-acetyltransferase [Candidatus Methanoperedens sp.]|nr:GNAT family N-acetyltransferase [Candidatus Methanoperedens sp.]
MEIDLKIAGDSEAAVWDKIVDSSPHGTIFHKWKWLKIAEKHSRSRLYPVMGYKGTTVIGIYPLFFQKMFGISCVFSPPPATAVPFLGPIIVGYDALKQNKKESVSLNFQKSIDKFIFSELKSNYTLISLVPGLDPRSFAWNDYNIKALFDYNLDLSKGIERIWQDFDKHTRDHIKKTEMIKRTDGAIDIIQGSKDDIIHLYNQIVRRYREQKKPVTVPMEYLLDIWDAFYPDNLKVFAIRYNGSIIGGIVAILYKDRISFWIGGTKPEIKNFSPNELNHWETLKWAYDNGFKIYEEFGANSENLCMSKSKYNPSLSVRFVAHKYSSFVYALAERGYTDVLKKGYGLLLSFKE